MNHSYFGELLNLEQKRCWLLKCQQGCIEVTFISCGTTVIVTLGELSISKKYVGLNGVP